MTERIFYTMMISLIFCVSTIRSEEIGPEVPRDSLTDSLQQSFANRLDSAAMFFDAKQYRQSVRMYVTSFEELKRFNEHRRQYAEQYLAELFETDQKEQRILFLDEVLPLKERQNLLLVILCIFLFGMFVALFIFLKYYLRSIRLKAEQKENENRLMELEKEERLLENRLHTMEVEKYQKELLAESLLVNHKNKVLDDLRLFLVQNPKLNLYKPELEHILNPESTVAEESTFQSHINDIHPAFYTRLQQQAGDKLTTLDLEYCRMIFMKMSSKEMADILAVEPKTVRVSKYRLKRKLCLEKEDDLGEFIERMGQH